MEKGGEKVKATATPTITPEESEKQKKENADTLLKE